METSDIPPKPTTTFAMFTITGGGELIAGPDKDGKYTVAMKVDWSMLCACTASASRRRSASADGNRG